MEDKDLDPDDANLSREDILLEQWGDRVFELVIAFDGLPELTKEKVLALVQELADWSEIARQLESKLKG